MKSRKVKISALQLDPNNARQHPQHNIDAIKASLERWGQQKPILVDKDGIVRAGNGLLIAAKALQWKALDVVETDLTDKELAAYAIADNRTGELSEWSAEIKDIIDGLKLDLPDLDSAALGFDDIELEDDAAEQPEQDGDSDADPQVDRAEELRQQWGVETGQLWQLGEHRIMCGDSANIDDATKVLDGQKADAMFTDPPYGVAYVGKTKDALTIENDAIDESQLDQFCKAWFDVAEQSTRDGAYWLATVPAGPLHSVFLCDWKARGILRQVLVWNKDSMVLGHSEYHYKHEPILFGWRPGGDRLKNDDRTKTTAWDFERPKASREHPTMKPVAMWVYGIKNHSKHGDIIYEPFSGSGTTIIACEQLGRTCRAIEISPAYVAVALQRWADATGKTPELIGAP